MLTWACDHVLQRMNIDGTGIPARDHVPRSGTHLAVDAKLPPVGGIVTTMTRTGTAHVDLTEMTEIDLSEAWTITLPHGTGMTTPRRWRDDGKRDERVAVKREREKEDKDKDRENRWQTTEDRDSRLKRVAGRDRKNADDGKDKDRRDDRDKDKEKEPAWMETYVPDASGGILGGRTADGEMDSIQAWKKGMKEKEEKDKAAAAKDTTLRPSTDTAGRAEPQMDEIQLFKMMIKREADKKGDQEVVQGTNDPLPVLSK
jgi:hypothetical protein